MRQHHYLGFARIVGCALHYVVTIGAQGETHPSRGSTFAPFIIAGLVKSYLNRGEGPTSLFWRGSNGNEVDLLIEQGQHVMLAEIKTGKTVIRQSFAGLEKWVAVAGNRGAGPALVHGGAKAIATEEYLSLAGQRAEI